MGKESCCCGNQQEECSFCVGFHGFYLLRVRLISRFLLLSFPSSILLTQAIGVLLAYLPCAFAC